MNPRPTNRTRALLITLGLLLASPGWADQPLYISADKVVIDDAKGVSSYLGRVELSQGGLSLQAARISVHRKGDQLSRLEAVGKPVRFTQGKGDEQTRAEANSLLYDLRSGEIRLSGGVHLWQGGNEFSGESISYDVKKRLVKAERGSGSGSEGRIHAIIRPQSPLKGSPESKEKQP